jgi:DNA-binding MarR family transcriptional regulator
VLKEQTAKIEAGAGRCPEGRLSTSTKVIGGRQVIDLDTYIPSFLSTINNSLSRGASQRYRTEFGIGIVEWRVISMLAIEPRIPAVRICEVISTDKGQVSRALVTLADAQLVESEVISADARKKKWWLTQSGYDLHSRILKIALEREHNLIEGCDADDLEAFLRVARIMSRNVSSL